MPRFNAQLRVMRRKIMGHTKNANTVFPNDRVKVVGRTVNKIASNEEGTVIGADPDSGRVNVKFGDGRTDWVDPEQVEKL